MAPLFAEHDLGEGVLALLLHDLVDQSVGLLRDGPVGHEVVGAAGVVDRINRVGRDEGGDADRLVLGRPELLQLGGVEQHVLALGELVAADDVLLPNLAVDRAGLLVLDAAVALLVELVELSRRWPGCCWR
jgi:hypothetical protein